MDADQLASRGPRGLLAFLDEHRAPGWAQAWFEAVLTFGLLGLRNAKLFLLDVCACEVRNWRAAHGLRDLSHLARRLQAADGNRIRSYRALGTLP